MSSVETLLTAQEYAKLPDSGPTELVRGKVVTMNPPSPLHGKICARVVRELVNFADEHDLGHILSNDAGVVTEQDPDTVRGADVAFYSYTRVPKDGLGNEYLPVAPDLVFEVLSPGNRRNEVLAKTAEYLACGVRAVCVLDAANETAEIFTSDRPTQLLTSDDQLTFPEILGGFSVLVSGLFK